MFHVMGQWKNHCKEWTISVFQGKQEALDCIQELQLAFDYELEVWIAEAPIGAEVRKTLEVALETNQECWTWDGGEWEAFDLMEEVEARKEEDEDGAATPYTDYERKVAGALYEMLCRQA